jgi:hypothetical protein
LVIQSERKLSFYQVSSNIPEPKLFTTFIIPEEIFVYDLAVIPPDKTASLIGITPEGIVIYPFNGQEFVKPAGPAFKTKTFFACSEQSESKGVLTGPPLHKTLFYQPFILIPGEGKFILIKSEPLTNTSPSFILHQEIPVPLITSQQIEGNLTEPLQTMVALPIPYFVDLNNDKRLDLAIYQDGFLAIYMQDECGKFINLTGAEPLDMALSRRKVAETDWGYTITPVFKDINGDNRPDLLVSDGSKGITAVFLNRSNTEKLPFQAQKPDITKRINGWLINHMLTDLNNDGLADLVLVLMRRVGVVSGLKLLTAQSVDWEIEIYPANQNPNIDSLRSLQVYADHPSYARTMSVPFSLSLTPENLKVQTPYILSMEGDFNQDKMNDLVIKEGASSQLNIYFGNKKGGFNQAPDLSFNLSAPANFTTTGVPYGVPLMVDLNNDNVPDLVIHQQDFTSRHHFFELLTSR